MKLKIKISLHADEFTLNPIIETECCFEIEQDQSTDHLEELFHFVVGKKLQKQEERLRGAKHDE